MAGTKRILVISRVRDEQALRQRLEQQAGEAELELKVVVPIEPASDLDLFTGEVDDSIAAAGERAERSADGATDSGQVETAEAEVGDVDTPQAVADALATFEAEQIVLVDLGEELEAEIRERFELPVSSL
jgi:hypothetical protein